MQRPHTNNLRQKARENSATCTIWSNRSPPVWKASRASLSFLKGQIDPGLCLLIHSLRVFCIASFGTSSSSTSYCSLKIISVGYPLCAHAPHPVGSDRGCTSSRACRRCLALRSGLRRDIHRSATTFMRDMFPQPMTNRQTDRQTDNQTDRQMRT